jgi:hypothetical protein
MGEAIGRVLYRPRHLYAEHEGFCVAAHVREEGGERGPLGEVSVALQFSDRINRLQREGRVDALPFR